VKAGPHSHRVVPVTGRTLVVTNDFPPRVGGIESFVLAMVQRMDPAAVVVHTARQAGDAAFDADMAFPVIRDPSRITAADPVDHQALGGHRSGDGLRLRLIRSRGSAGDDGRGVEVEGRRPPHSGDHSRARGVVGQDAGTRTLLHRIGESNDVLTYLGEYTRSQSREPSRRRQPLGWCN
jgi:phosphatidyl-myo-inositol dimannoside synthase